MEIIDYKEKYEQALERAKYYHDRDNIQFLENIFQELKGSEGERIRKELLDFCKNRAEKYSNDPKYKNISAWISWLEKQLKQKPTISNEALREGIIKFGITQYQIDNWLKKYVDVDLEFSCLSTSQNNIRSWTIQDAKDGDVLVASDGSIFLFAGMVDCACKYYVALATDDVIIFNEGLKYYWETSRAVHPATKGQCDLLFQKMKEAGYEWDTEKKELKKVEQKSAETEKGTNGNEREIPNSAWSEEDEYTLECLIDYLVTELDNSYLDEDKKIFAKEIKLLEYIKDRGIPQLV